jgi:hypothetical protein
MIIIAGTVQSNMGFYSAGGIYNSNTGMMAACVAPLLVSNERNRQVDCHKRSKLFARVHNETPSVPVCINNPDCSPFAWSKAALPSCSLFR